MLISLRKQVDGLVNVYAPRENTSVTIPSRFASEIAAFRWLLSQNGCRIMVDMRDEEDAISSDYEVEVKRK